MVEANGTPVAVDDDYMTGFGDGLTIGAGEGLLANDSDPDFDPISVTAFQQAANGELAVFPDGSFTYTPDAGFSGTETILYTISDGFDVATATLSIVVEANNLPVAVDDDYTTGFGDDLTIGAGEGLLANDSDPDFDPISVTAFQQAANGELSVFPDGSFTYTPDAGFSGTETILYTISDGFDVATATLTIEVAGEEDRPFIFGTAGGDRLIAPGTGAIIDGGAGRDVFIAGAGADTFILSDGDGDQFRRFDASMDQLDISAWGAESFDELVIFDRAGQQPDSKLITIFHAESNNLAFHYEIGDRLSAEDFTADNFIFANPLNLG
ncbi:MAG: Ig-like domain-containing protein [Pikeienuella sp.]|uniref:Ig-like domain-containing protein n=1 Tax=Pikeienuella sp. TaxID=2831957 RepID=UPI00391983A7